MRRILTACVIALSMTLVASAQEVQQRAQQMQQQPRGPGEPRGPQRSGVPGQQQPQPDRP